MKGRFSGPSGKQRELEGVLEGFQWAAGVGERTLQMPEGVAVIADVALGRRRTHEAEP